MENVFKCIINELMVWFGFMVFSHNISVISWRSVLLVKYPEKTDLSQVSDELYHYNVVSSTPQHARGLNSQL